MVKARLLQINLAKKINTFQVYRKNEPRKLFIWVLFLETSVIRLIYAISTLLLDSFTHFFSLLLTKVWENALSVSYQVFCKNSHKPFLFLKVRILILFLRQLHKFSMRLRSQYCLGQMKRSTLLSLNHSFYQFECVLSIIICW